MSLLNYNPLAKAKYALTGKQYCFKENPELYTSKQMEEFYTMDKKRWYNKSNYCMNYKIKIQ